MGIRKRKIVSATPKNIRGVLVGKVFHSMWWGGSQVQISTVRAKIGLETNEKEVVIQSDCKWWHPKPWIRAQSYAKKEDLRRGANLYIEEIITFHRRLLQLSATICNGFKEHFKALCRGPDLEETSFQEYFRDFSTVETHEAARCKVPIREGQIVVALSYFGASKAPNVESLPCETSLKMPHMIVHLLALVFNNWFNHVNIP